MIRDPSLTLRPSEGPEVLAITRSSLPRPEKLRAMSRLLLGVDEPTPTHILLAASRGFGPARDIRAAHLRQVDAGQ